MLSVILQLNINPYCELELFMKRVIYMLLAVYNQWHNL
jgi:hypothetical protein